MKSTVTAVILSGVLASCARAGGSSALPQATLPQSARDRSSSGFKTLVEFNLFDGCYPMAGVVAGKSAVYGTTTCGGRFGDGDVYAVTPGGKLSVIHNFAGDAHYPYAPVTLVGSALYGTATGGGTHHDGTVYSLALDGKERWVYSFRNQNFPFAGLVNLNGTFYGTTVQGGQGHCPYSGPGCGTVYEISSSGEEKTLYSFRGGPKDGSAPWAGLVALNGVLYGTTSSGGSGNTGILYSLTTLGKEHVLHSFDGGTDGGNPYGTLIAVNGTLYGTTEFGGSGGNWGTVYSMTTSGQEQIIYSFGSGGQYDALEPQAGLLYVNGEFYGTTVEGGKGGSKCGPVGCGTIYELSPSGQEQVLYSFRGGTDGEEPQSQLAVLDGVLYGTTPYGGGPYSYGTVFSYKL